MAEARCLNQNSCDGKAIEQGKHCRATRLCQTKFVNNINVFWWDCVFAGRYENICYVASVHPEFGATLA